MVKWKIIADSGCDYKQLTNLASDTLFEVIPFTITIGQHHFRDDSMLDIDKMMDAMEASSEAAGSACPSPQDYIAAYQGAKNIVVVTLTGSLSGSYNSARVAKEMFLEEHPTVNIHLIDSLSAGGEMDLLISEINRLIALDTPYETLVSEITAYQQKTKLLFVLARVNNLVKNGRLSKLVGAVVGLLNIRMVGEASQEGKLELLQKARGHKKAITAAFDEMIKAGYNGGRVIIAHRENEKFCHQLIERVQKSYPHALIEILPTSGLCSFYAEENGVMMGYEVG